ncbi:tetratricopeptide repeat protein [Streptomyces sp. NPDC048357]|uniref:tetratricopeptide repeat protein n=1 Tax=Streptomyces sp. NPDC048357 TaxID=3154719 RepID=UPI00342343D4
MEFDRRVQIWVPRPGSDEEGFGSGYLVAPRLALTAAHVTDGAPGTQQGAVTVSRPDVDEREFPATVCWRRKDEVVDAALIEVEEGHGWHAPESLCDLLARPPQRFGRLIGSRPHAVTLVGFPRMQREPDGRRLDEQLTGQITPGTGSLACRYEVSSTDPILSTALSDAGTHWSGMSGAAVLSDDAWGGELLCGVTRRDRQASGGSRLTATPAALLLADEDFCARIAEHTGWEPVVEPVEAAGLFSPAESERDLNSPASLLRADAEAVTFHGRESELADLRNCCETGPVAVSVRVLTGPGGQGKTRLARYLTDALSREGWVTGHLRADLTDQDPPPDFSLLTTALPLLVVVDYAETRPRLLRRLITHLHRSRHRVRLLLLARSAGEWLTDSLNAAPAARRLLAAAPVTELGPLIPRSRPTEERLTAFTRAAQDLARLLPRVPTLPPHDWAALAATLQPPDDLSHPRYDNALTLQLTALVTLLQRGPAPAETVPGAPAEEILLQHERRFWDDSADAPAFKLNLPTPLLAAAVAVAAMCGAPSKNEAIDVIDEIPDLPADKAARTAAWLATLYPAELDRYWGSLQPDRIAEYHAAQTLANGDISLPALLNAAAPGQQVQLITVLARATVAHYNAARATDSERLLRILEVALDTASLSYQVVSTATAALPYPSRITSPLAVRLITALPHVGQQLTEAKPTAADESGLATLLSNLGLHLSEVGRRAEALTATTQAVEINRRLAADNPAAYEPDLASSLSNLGIHLLEAGRRNEALGAEQQAVDIRRRLAADNPAAYEPGLATSLANLGTYLSEAGRRSEALGAEQQAVDIRRRLAADNPAAYEPRLASSLSNLGARLSEVGRWNEALSAEQQAVDIRRRLAADNPAAYEPDLASSLSNLSLSLAEAGRRAEALTASTQAVEINRRLAADNPAAYEPRLATSLSNLGIRLREAGQSAEALTAGTQAVEIHGRLAADNPAAYEPDLATLLSNLGTYLSEGGRWGEALSAEQQAVDIRRRLAADNPAAYEPDLATSLSNLGMRLSEVGRGNEAFSVTDQAVEIYRRLAADNPAAYEPHLATSLAAWAWVRSEAQQDLAGALRATGEAVELYRHLVARPTRFVSQLSAVLHLQAYLLTCRGRFREAREIRSWLGANAAELDSHK